MTTKERKKVHPPEFIIVDHSSSLRGGAGFTHNEQPNGGINNNNLKRFNMMPESRSEEGDRSRESLPQLVSTKNQRLEAPIYQMNNVVNPEWGDINEGGRMPSPTHFMTVAGLDRADALNGGVTGDDDISKDSTGSVSDSHGMPANPVATFELLAGIEGLISDMKNAIDSGVPASLEDETFDSPESSSFVAMSKRSETVTAAGCVRVPLAVDQESQLAKKSIVTDRSFNCSCGRCVLDPVIELNCLPGQSQVENIECQTETSAPMTGSVTYFTVSEEGVPHSKADISQTTRERPKPKDRTDEDEAPPKIPDVVSPDISDNYEATTEQKKEQVAFQANDPTRNTHDEGDKVACEIALTPLDISSGNDDSGAIRQIEVEKSKVTECDDKPFATEGMAHQETIVSRSPTREDRIVSIMRNAVVVLQRAHEEKLAEEMLWAITVIAETPSVDTRSFLGKNQLSMEVADAEEADTFRNSPEQVLLKETKRGELKDVQRIDIHEQLSFENEVQDLQMFRFPSDEERQDIASDKECVASNHQWEELGEKSIGPCAQDTPAMKETPEEGAPKEIHGVSSVSADRMLDMVCGDCNAKSQGHVLVEDYDTVREVDSNKSHVLEAAENDVCLHQEAQEEKLSLKTESKGSEELHKMRIVGGVKKNASLKENNPAQRTTSPTLNRVNEAVEERVVGSVEHDAENVETSFDVSDNPKNEILAEVPSGNNATSKVKQLFENVFEAESITDRVGQRLTSFVQNDVSCLRQFVTADYGDENEKPEVKNNHAENIGDIMQTMQFPSDEERYDITLDKASPTGGCSTTEARESNTVPIDNETSAHSINLPEEVNNRTDALSSVECGHLLDAMLGYITTDQNCVVLAKNQDSRLKVVSKVNDYLEEPEEEILPVTDQEEKSPSELQTHAMKKEQGSKPTAELERRDRSESDLASSTRDTEVGTPLNTKELLESKVSEEQDDTGSCEVSKQDASITEEIPNRRLSPPSEQHVLPTENHGMTKETETKEEFKKQSGLDEEELVGDSTIEPKNVREEVAFVESKKIGSCKEMDKDLLLEDETCGEQALLMSNQAGVQRELKLEVDEVGSCEVTGKNALLSDKELGEIIASWAERLVKENKSSLFSIREDPVVVPIENSLESSKTAFEVFLVNEEESLSNSDHGWYSDDSSVDDALSLIEELSIEESVGSFNDGESSNEITPEKSSHVINGDNSKEKSSKLDGKGNSSTPKGQSLSTYRNDDEAAPNVEGQNLESHTIKTKEFENEVGGENKAASAPDGTIDNDTTPDHCCVPIRVPLVVNPACKGDENREVESICHNVEIEAHMLTSNDTVDVVENTTVEAFKSEINNKGTVKRIPTDTPNQDLRTDVNASETAEVGGSNNMHGISQIELGESHEESHGVSSKSNFCVQKGSEELKKRVTKATNGSEPSQCTEMVSSRETILEFLHAFACSRQIVSYEVRGREESKQEKMSTATVLDQSKLGETENGDGDEELKQTETTSRDEVENTLPEVIIKSNSDGFETLVNDQNVAPGVKESFPESYNTDSIGNASIPCGANETVVNVVRMCKDVKAACNRPSCIQTNTVLNLFSSGNDNDDSNDELAAACGKVDISNQSESRVNGEETMTEASSTYTKQSEELDGHSDHQVDMKSSQDPEIMSSDLNSLDHNREAIQHKAEFTNHSEPQEISPETRQDSGNESKVTSGFTDNQGSEFEEDFRGREEDNPLNEPISVDTNDEEKVSLVGENEKETETSPFPGEQPKHDFVEPKLDINYTPSHRDECVVAHARANDREIEIKSFCGMGSNQSEIKGNENHSCATADISIEHAITNGEEYKVLHSASAATDNKSEPTKSEGNSKEGPNQESNDQKWSTEDMVEVVLGGCACGRQTALPQHQEINKEEELLYDGNKFGAQNDTKAEDEIPRSVHTDDDQHCFTKVQTQEVTSGTRSEADPADKMLEYQSSQNDIDVRAKDVDTTEGDDKNLLVITAFSQLSEAKKKSSENKNSGNTDADQQDSKNEPNSVFNFNTPGKSDVKEPTEESSLISTEDKGDVYAIELDSESKDAGVDHGEETVTIEEASRTIMEDYQGPLQHGDNTSREDQACRLPIVSSVLTQEFSYGADKSNFDRTEIGDTSQDTKTDAKAVEATAMTTITIEVQERSKKPIIVCPQEMKEKARSCSILDLDNDSLTGETEEANLKREDVTGLEQEVRSFVRTENSVQKERNAHEEERDPANPEALGSGSAPEATNTKENYIKPRDPVAHDIEMLSKGHEPETETKREVKQLENMKDVVLRAMRTQQTEDPESIDGTPEKSAVDGFLHFLEGRKFESYGGTRSIFDQVRDKLEEAPGKEDKEGADRDTEAETSFSNSSLTEFNTCEVVPKNDDSKSEDSAHDRAAQTETKLYVVPLATEGTEVDVLEKKTVDKEKELLVEPQAIKEEAQEAQGDNQANVSEDEKTCAGVVEIHTEKSTDSQLSITKKTRIWVVQRGTP